MFNAYSKTYTQELAPRYSLLIRTLKITEACTDTNSALIIVGINVLIVTKTKRNRCNILNRLLSNTQKRKYENNPLHRTS